MQKIYAHTNTNANTRARTFPGDEFFGKNKKQESGNDKRDVP